MTQNEFIEELEKIGIKVDEKKLKSLEIYYNMLIEYNNFMNLTGITDKGQVYLKHFYDSLTLTKIIDLNKEESLCDLGSGAGFPGIVIKIFYPNLNIVLVDSLAKRINFLNDVIKKLKLDGIKAVHARIEDYAKENEEKFDIVTARAVAPLNILLELGIKLNKVGKYFISMKGNIAIEQNFDNSIKKLKCNLDKILTFKLPKEDSNRALIKIVKVAKTPTVFPRKYSEIKKKPL